MEKARVAYEYVVNRYPDSQQAEYARQAIARIQAQQKP
jgi:TolA-binding protein